MDAAFLRQVKINVLTKEQKELNEKREAQRKKENQEKNEITLREVLAEVEAFRFFNYEKDGKIVNLFYSTFIDRVKEFIKQSFNPRYIISSFGYECGQITTEFVGRDYTIKVNFFDDNISIVKYKCKKLESVSSVTDVESALNIIKGLY